MPTAVDFTRTATTLKKEEQTHLNAASLNCAMNYSKAKHFTGTTGSLTVTNVFDKALNIPESKLFQPQCKKINK